MLYNTNDILETTRMITENNLDVRTITMGISLRDCADPDVTVCARKIYDKITRCAKDLVKVGTNLEAELGVPIIHKRISVTPISLVGEACQTDTYVLGHNGYCLFFRGCWLHQGRHQHECRAPHGGSCQKNGRFDP